VNVAQIRALLKLTPRLLVREIRSPFHLALIRGVRSALVAAGRTSVTP
jgi:hypothetical protein